ncbi:MAG: DUF3107 family protein, partial [Acidimicrobiales bacterium]|nr:DUF3107 family protein [Acidimicrobiales bacterium]
MCSSTWTGPPWSSSWCPRWRRSAPTSTSTEARDSPEASLRRRRLRWHAVDVRIGVIQSPREVEVDVADDADRDQLLAEVEKLLQKGDGVLWFTDRRGR